jgi:hypothetical protein
LVVVVQQSLQSQGSQLWRRHTPELLPGRVVGAWPPYRTGNLHASCLARSEPPQLVRSLFISFAFDWLRPL